MEWRKGLPTYSKAAALCAISLVMLAGCALMAEGSPEGLPEGVAISSIELSPSVPEDVIMFVGTESNGVFRSDDGGLSWTATDDGIESLIAEDSGIESLPVLDIALSPSFAEDGEAYFGTITGLYKSVDGGRSWKMVEGTQFKRVVEIMLSPDYPMDRTLLVTALRDYVGSGGSLWRSTDAGESWSGISSDRHSGIPRYAEFLPDGTLVGATIEDLSRSSDYGDSWRPIYSGSFVSWFFSVSPGFAQDGVAFFADPTGRKNVQRVVAGTPIGTGFTSGADVECHLHGYGAMCPFPPVFSPTFEEDGTILAQTGRGLLRSTDRGDTWDKVSLPSSERVIAIAFSPRFSDDRTVFAATLHTLFISEDAGDSWERLHPPAVSEG